MNMCLCVRFHRSTKSKGVLNVKTIVKVDTTPQDGKILVSLSDRLSEVVLDGAKVNVKGKEAEVAQLCENFLATISYINNLSYAEDSLAINGVSYSISDYKVADAFVGFILPRRVAITNDYKAIDLHRPIIYVTKAGRILNPREFQEAQRTLFNLYKVDPSITRAISDEGLALLGDVKVHTNGTLVADTAGGKRMPVALIYEFWTVFHYTDDVCEYIYEYLNDVRASMRRTSNGG